MQQSYKKWVCLVCGWTYDEAKGDAAEGFPPGTRWQDIPEDWVCLECGVSKKDFIMIEMAVPKEVVVRERFNAPVVVVGSGYAGISQVKALRKINADIPIILVCGDLAQEYPKPSLSNALSRHKSADEVVRHSADELSEKLAIDILAKTTLSEINPIHKTIVTNNGQIKYSKLVLALGAIPHTLRIEGDATDEILQVNHLEDYRIFRQRLENANNILIVGGGLIGCEFANDLYHYRQHKPAINITLVSDVAYPMAPIVPERAGDLLQQSLAINWQFNTTLTALNRSANTSANTLVATLKNGETIETDLVLSAIGLKANTELAQQAKLKIDSGIVVNETMQTSNQHIYAIGDCAQTKEGVLPFIAPISHQVQTAALNIVGQKAALNYPPMPVKVKVDAGLVFLAPPKTAKVRWVISQSEKGLKAITHGRKGRINGFMLMGEAQKELSDVLKKTDINN